MSLSVFHPKLLSSRLRNLSGLFFVVFSLQLLQLQQKQNPVSTRTTCTSSHLNSRAEYHGLRRKTNAINRKRQRQNWLSSNFRESWLSCAPPRTSSGSVETGLFQWNCRQWNEQRHSEVTSACQKIFTLNAFWWANSLGMGGKPEIYNSRKEDILGTQKQIILGRRFFPCVGRKCVQKFWFFFQGPVGRKRKKSHQSENLLSGEETVGAESHAKR